MADAVMEESLLNMGRVEFGLFRDLIHRHTGIWLRDGKEVMLASRLSRRLRRHRIASFADYYEYVQQTQDGGRELSELINCVTTNKTAFFREAHHFDFLSQTVIPAIMDRSREPVQAGVARHGGLSRPSLRIWSAACSTGEEPYSIAITLLQARAAQRLSMSAAWDTRILASDIDTVVLEKAMRGIYGAEELEDIAPELQKRYFLRGKEAMAGSVKVKKQVAALVEFQRINLVDPGWPLDSLFDAVFFRNALIYFRQETQDQVLRRILRRLKPGGYLFLGHSEHIPWLHDILEPLQKTIYRLRSRAA